MYYEHFGFRHAPFKITPDTSLFFPGGNRGAILEAMSYAIRNGEGIVKVAGEVGSGKTMLCRMLELELPANIEIVYLANPRLSPDNILQAIAFELKLPVSDGDNRLQVMQSLHNYLLERHADNKQVVVFVEEAQSMPLATLEEIRLLSNLETNQHKLLQIVLFGQPELDEMLAKPQIRQLKERITYHFNLEPLRQGEIRDYLNARLSSSGYRGGSLFTSGAIRQIAKYSRGLLRRVNILADKALLAAYADNSRRVGRRQVMAAVKDSEFGLPWTHYVWSAVLAVLLLAVSLFAYQRYNGIWNWPQLGSMAAPFAAGAEEADKQMIEQAGPDFRQSRPSVPDELRMDTQPIDNGYAWATRPSPENRSQKRVEKMLADAGEEVKASLTDGKITELEHVNKPVIKYSDASLSMMQAQLRKLPPEEIWMDAPKTADYTCTRCVAIIYRPLQQTEKL